MYLVYVHNNFSFDLFLTFLLPLISIFAFIKFELILGHLCAIIEELCISGKTSLTCLRAKCDKTVSLENLY